MSTSAVDIFVVRFGSGWLAECYVAGEDTPVAYQWRKYPKSWPTPEEALAEVPAKLRRRAIRCEVIR